MTFRFDVKGLEVTTRVPTLAQLTTVKSHPRGPQDYGVCRDLVKGTIMSPGFVKLCEQRPGCVMGLAVRILEAAGVGGAVLSLEEPELEGDQAAAWGPKVEESERLFPDPEDIRRKLFPILVRNDLGEERRFIIRPPIEREVEALRKANTAEAAQAFCKKIVVWGDLASLEHEQPGMYITIAEWALDQVGDWEAVRLGES